MLCHFINRWIQSCILLIFAFYSFTAIYSQESQPNRELDEAIDNAKNAHYELAIPVLKKYAEINGFDDFKTLEINIYLNLCYLATKSEALDVVKVNALTDFYFEKYGISKTDTSRSADELTSLYYVSLINKNVGEMDKMILYLSLIIKNYEENHLKVDQTYCQTLVLTAYGYYNLQNYKSAIEVAQKAWKVNLDLFGEKSEASLQILDLLYSSFKSNSELEKSTEYLKKEVDIGKVFWGEKNLEYVSRLSDLANLYSKLGDYKKALEVYLKVIELQKEVLGENNKDYLKSLISMATIYSDLGNYLKANEINLKIVDLGKEVFGENDPSYLTNLNDLAVSYVDLGDYNKALEIITNVVRVKKEIWGENNRNYLISLSNKSMIFAYSGDYQNALEINLRVVELQKEVCGENDDSYIISLNNLALAYLRLGDYSKALQISQRAVDLGKMFWGEDNSNYLKCLSNLAQSFSKLGDYQKALENNLKVLEIRKVILGEKSLDYLTSLNNVAVIYIELGNYQKALEINLQVIELTKEILGQKHTRYLGSLNNLASVYSHLGDYQKALEINLKVVELGKEILGENSPGFIFFIKNLAISEMHLSITNEALSHYNIMLSKTKEIVIRYFSLMTEYQREQFWKQYGKDFTLFPTFYENADLFPPEVAGDAYNFFLFSKGLLLNTTLDFDDLIAKKGTPEAIAKFEELKLIRLEIQRLLEKPIAERYLNVDSVENIAQQKETELVKISKEYGDYTSNLKVTWKDVQANLQDKDVAIEFVEYPTLTDTVKYAALVLRKEWQYPKFIPLFRKDEIEGLIKLDKNRIYSNHDHIGKQLRNLIWTPLETVVSPGDRVYFSPAGIIHLLAIENLPVDDSTTLGDRYQMYRLSSTKELVIHQKEAVNQYAVLYGGLQYDLSDEKMISESKKYEKRENLYAMRGYSNDSAVRKGWAYLSGTLQEVDQINQLMNSKNYNVKKFTGASGNEESFKSLSGNRSNIIHIATHGFFLPIEEGKKNLFIQMRMGDQQETGGGIDPMLRSGLIMAGGNWAWQGGKASDSIEDGVLTAREISRMDLRSTDIVVLSACETGLGEVSSEGVFGLQRSFKQAGVRTLVMSLWEVNDDATKYFMTEFYSNLLSGKDKRAAFLEAKRKCKEKYIYPQYWAAFIMLD